MLSLLSAFLLSGQAAGRNVVCSSEFLVATFSKDGTLTTLQNKLTGERMNMEGASQFAFLTDSAEINDRNCQRTSLRETPHGLEASYAHPGFEVKVSYELRPPDHFLEKRVRIRHLGVRSFAIKRFSLGAWVAGGPSGTVTPFQHGQCVTYFLRQQKGGFLFGVRTPFEEIFPADAKRLDLAYPVNMIFNPGATYEAETAYWGVYRLTGRFAPKAPPKIKESVLSQVLPDLGESEAMLKMVRKLAPPRGGMTLVYNGYQGGLYLGDYGEPAGMAQAEQDVETLRLVNEMLGRCIVQPAGPFFGAFREALQLTPKDQRLEAPPARQKLVDWINANGMTAMHWACLKAVHGWLEPRLGPYCPDHPAWQADEHANCAANPAYMEWFTKIVIEDIKKGYSGFVSDEPPPGLRYQLRCEKPNHQHLAGDVSYAYFYSRREFFKKLRQTFGDHFELQGQRPHMDAGIWDAIYLNSVFTFLEDPGLKAETFRLWSRMRRHYSFVPSYMDQIMVQPGFEPVDYTMLSALAVSSSYLFIAPSSKEKLKAHAQAILRNNRTMAIGLREYPVQHRQRVRFWLDWARQHAAYMDEVIDLPDWPGSGKPDGYLRIKDGRGFAFLFNSGSSVQSIQVPLDRTMGLDGQQRYSLRQVFPAGSNQALLSQSNAGFTLAPESAYLIEIAPVSATR